MMLAPRTIIPPAPDQPRASGATGGRRRPFPRAMALAAMLLGLYALMALTAAWHEGATFDEPAHIGGGYNIWLNGDFRFDPANGDFVKRWATIPLLVSRPAFPPKTNADWRGANFFAVGQTFLFQSGNDADSILRRCRSMVVGLGVMLGALVFALARRQWGDVGGLIALTLFVFSPDMLAYGALVSTDLATALGFFAATWFSWRLLHRVTWGGLVSSVLSVALLVTTKLSAVLIVPIALLLVGVRLLGREPWVWRLGAEKIVTARRRQGGLIGGLALLHIAAAWGALWAVYNFKYAGRPANDPNATFTPAPANASVLSRPAALTLEIGRRYHLLPEAYLAGVEGLAGVSQRRPSFMDGHWKAGGRRWFFPYAFSVKTPPALLFLLALGCAGGWAAARRAREPVGSKARSRRVLYELTPVLALILVYGGAAVVQNVNIGHRHLLPIYPALYVLAGAAALWRPTRSRWAAVLAGVAMAWYVAGSLWVRPHYLAYFNLFAGGPAQGYRRLVDSSLDWGQDLPVLARWLRTHNRDEPRPVYLGYFGTDRPEYRGLACRRLPGFPDWRDREVFAYQPGYYAISATMAESVYSVYFGPWNRAYEDEYRAVGRQLGLDEQNTADSDTLAARLQQQPESEWQGRYARYEQLRFARLCAWLRATHRAPDATAGYSILVWDLDAVALHQALWGPPVELHAAPAAESPDGG